MKSHGSYLPYRDTKPQGAADFYFAIVATFRFVIAKRGHDGWVRYLREMGQQYFAPVNQMWAKDGLDAVEGYWKEFFAAEPGASVEVERDNDSVTIHVHTCPMIAQLRNSDRAPLACLCQHCFYLNDARAADAGLAMRLEGGNGSCRHSYRKREDVQPQEMDAIKEFRLC
jgi:hypothetical protein